MIKRQIPGQEAFFEQEGPRLDSRAAFGRVPNPRFTDTDPLALRAEITGEDIERVSLDAMTGYAFGDEGNYTYRGVAFRPDEYEVIVRSHQAFGAAVMGKTLHARELDPSTDRRLGTAVRSETHAYESKLEKIGGMISGYESELGSVGKLLKEARSPGYAHMGEAELRMLVTSLRDLYARNILTVAATRFEWTDEMVKGANKALDYRFGSEDYRANFRYIRGVAELDQRYAHARRALAVQNQKATLREIAANR